MLSSPGRKKRKRGGVKICLEGAVFSPRLTGNISPTIINTWALALMTGVGVRVCLSLCVPVCVRGCASRALERCKIPRPRANKGGSSDFEGFWQRQEASLAKWDDTIARTSQGDAIARESGRSTLAYTDGCAGKQRCGQPQSHRTSCRCFAGERHRRRQQPAPTIAHAAPVSSRARKMRLSSSAKQYLQSSIHTQTSLALACKGFSSSRSPGRPSSSLPPCLLHPSRLPAHPLFHSVTRPQSAMITGLDVAPLALPTCVSKEGEVREERRGGQRGRKGDGERKREGKRTRAGAGKIDSARETTKQTKQTRSIALMTSLKPSNTHPKTQCLPSRCGVTSVVMKNCDPLVPGPALAWSASGRDQMEAGRRMCGGWKESV